jgi:rRNA-processing protein EBP2
LHHLSLTDLHVTSYKQALHGANTARDLAKKHALPFSRPADYFAEMAKSDVHMERVHQRLLDKRAAIEKSEERRKERAAKKFGKQLQIEKLKEREKNKKEFADRIKLLKRSKTVLSPRTPPFDLYRDTYRAEKRARRPQSK